MILTTAIRAKYKRYFQGGDGKTFQDVPVPIREKLLVVGYEWVSTNLIDLLRKIPMYDCFRNCEDYYFDIDEMHKLTAFILNECVYPEGENTNKPFIPEMWQWAVFYNMFCWKRKDNDRRRYREVLVYVPRKNGKTSSFGSISSLYMFYVDAEQRSQNFCCAADIEQASINFKHTSFMIEQNPNMLSRLRQGKVNRSTRSFEHAKDGSMFKVLSAIAETKHGLSPSFAYIDEVHAHKNSELIDVIITGTAARSQSLILYTTTADYDRPSVCNELYGRAKAIAIGEQEDPTFLPVIYEADLDDDFREESTWEKANPNYGISVYPDYFERQIRMCKDNPSLLNRFLRLHLNVKTKTETVWIPSWVWANGNSREDFLLTVDEIKDLLYTYRYWHNFAQDPEFFSSSTVDAMLEEFREYYTWYFKKLTELKDSECYGGYDNSSVKDIASFSLYFPSESCSLSWFWVPADSIYRRTAEERIPYERWYRCGLINNTPLACISEQDIAKALTGYEGNPGICQHFRGMQMAAFDPWGSNFIYETLYNAGMEAKKYSQSYAGMNGPCRKLQADVENKDYFHGSNPLLKWMINNVTITLNNSDQMRPSKEKSTDKIDGIVSVLMSMGASMYNGQQMIMEIAGLRDA